MGRSAGATAIARKKYVRADASRYVPHHYALFIPRPNYVRGKTVHNSRGFRDSREFAPAPSGHKIRAVFIGGSSTYETKIDDNESVFSSLLERRLNDYARSGSPEWKGSFEVVNAGCGAATSAENLIRLIFFVADVQPDLVLIQQGLNDTMPRCYGETTSDYSNFRRIWAEGVDDSDATRPRSGSGLFMRLVNFILRRPEKIKAIGDYIVRRIPYDPELMRKNPPVYFRRYTEMMISICGTIGARPILVTEPYSEAFEENVAWRAEGFREHNEVLRDVASSCNVMLLDLHSRLRKDEFFADGRHFTEKGNELKADILFDLLMDGSVIQDAIATAAKASSHR